LGGNGNDRRDFYILDSVSGNLPKNFRINISNAGKIRFFVEMAVTKMFGNGKGDGWGGFGPTPTDQNCYMKLLQVELAIFDR
jgi:hypothetical protein